MTTAICVLLVLAVGACITILILRALDILKSRTPLCPKCGAWRLIPSVLQPSVSYCMKCKARIVEGAQ